MKRLFILTFVILLSLPSVFSNKEADFTIKAFKVGFSDSTTPQCKLVVTDALNYGLDTDLYGRELVLDPYVHRLLVSSSSEMNFNDQVVFSYRVEGNSKGTFNLAISLNALKNESSGIYIDTAYQLDNVSYVFTSGKSAFDNSGGYYFETSSQSFPMMIRLGSSEDGLNQSGDFSIYWQVHNSNELINDVWIARGAVAIGLLATSNDTYDSSYDKADPGKYSATCTVTLSAIS